MQRGLVDDRAMNRGCAIAFMPQAQSVEPSGPSGVEVSLDADLVAPSLVGWHAPKLEADVMSEPHHM